MFGMWEKYGDDVMNDIINGLVGSCTIGGPDLEVYGVEYDDIELVLADIEEDVYECASCGWWCEGGDKYFSETCGADVCEECYTDETNEDE